MRKWHELDVTSAAARLHTDAARGLEESAAAERLIASGPNELAPYGTRPAPAILREQLTATMVAIGGAAASVVFWAVEIEKWCLRRS